MTTFCHKIINHKILTPHLPPKFICTFSRSAHFCCKIVHFYVLKFPASRCETFGRIVGFCGSFVWLKWTSFLQRNFRGTRSNFCFNMHLENLTAISVVLFNKRSRGHVFPPGERLCGAAGVAWLHARGGELLTFDLCLSSGHRMCICHLPCRNLKPSLSGDQVT